MKRLFLLAYVAIFTGCASMKNAAHSANGWAERRSEAEDRKNFEACVQDVEYTHFKTLSGHDGMAEAFFTDKPTRPYEEIGRLAFTASSSSKTDNMVAVLKVRAAREGADAIINIQFDNAATGTSGNAYPTIGGAANYDQRTSFARVARATAIRFTDLAQK